LAAKRASSRTRTGAEADIREMEEDEAVPRRALNAAGLNNRDRDAATGWRRLPLSERLRQVDWAMLALMMGFSAAFPIPAARDWLG
jgi:hypothetical protein